MTDYTNLIDKVNIPELVKALLSASTVSTAQGKLMLDAAAAIEELQAQLPKRGKWKCSYPKIEANPMFMYGICSICGFEQGISNKLNYCPNCGAKMEV